MAIGGQYPEPTAQLPNHVGEDYGRILFEFVYTCGWQGPEYFQAELHDWQRHHKGKYWWSKIFFLYLWLQ